MKREWFFSPPEKAQFSYAVTIEPKIEWTREEADELYRYATEKMGYKPGEKIPMQVPDTFSKASRVNLTAAGFDIKD